MIIPTAGSRDLDGDGAPKVKRTRRAFPRPDYILPSRMIILRRPRLLDHRWRFFHPIESAIDKCVAAGGMIGSAFVSTHRNSKSDNF